MMQPSYLVGRTSVTLRTGMQMAMPQLAGSRLPKHAHILQQQCIHTDAVELGNHLKRILHLIIIDDGVHRDMNLGTKLMGILAELLDIIK